MSFDIQITRNNGSKENFNDYKDKVVLVVNTASKCGFTPQYKGLEELYNKFKDQGFTVLGFPCNQFGSQEPGTDEEVASFCELNYGVSFPLFSKIDVNGKDTHPLYIKLKKEAKGILGTEAVKWNFTKFLVSKYGESVERFAPKETPESLENQIKELLK